MNFSIKATYIILGLFPATAAIAENCPFPVSLNVEVHNDVDGGFEYKIRDEDSLPASYRTNSFFVNYKKIEDFTHVFSGTRLPSKEDQNLDLKNNDHGPFVNVSVNNPLYCYYKSSENTSVTITKNEALWLYKYHSKIMHYNLGSGWKYVVDGYFTHFECKAGDDCSFEFLP